MKDVVAGEPVEFDQPLAFRFTCCECGLVHMFVIETIENNGNTHIALKIYGDDHATNLRRAEGR